MYSKDRVSNTTTALMAIRDLATFHEIPINIHFEDHYIHVIVGFGTPEQKRMSYYLQDMYREHSLNDRIYNEIEAAIELLK